MKSIASRAHRTSAKVRFRSKNCTPIAGQLASYQYDAAGRVISLRQSTMVPTATGSTVAALPIDTAFTYDPVGRITASTHSPVTPPSLPTNIALSAITGPTSASYSYDANGNRSQSLYQQTSATGSTLQQQRDFTVDTQSNRLLGHTKTESTDGSQTSTADADYQYNAAGQLTHTGATGLALAYDAAGRMGQLAPATTPAQATRYQHNLLGQRVRKIDASQNTIALYGEAEQGMESMALGLYNSQTATGATEIIYLPTASGPMPIATLVKGVKYAIHSDHLNTPRRLTQTDGKVAWQWVTSAFGEVPPTTGKTRFVSPKVNPAITGATTLTAFDLRYPGQVEDQESGLFYNHKRFYGPLEGRYLQADPIGLEGGWNPYLYAEANPLMYIDPFGLAPDGHHWVIGPIRNDPNLSPVAMQVFKDARTGPVPGGHNFGEGHSSYNKGVNDLWKNYLDQNKCNPASMTKQQAEDFVSRVKTSDDPRVRNFNRRIYEKFIRAGFRRMPPTARSIE